MSSVILTHAGKRYADVVALDDVSVQFADGVTTAVVGPSGSGKSTLLKLINGLIRPTSGRVSVFGQPINERELSSLRRRMGYAVQRVGLFPHLTVEENIGLPTQLACWQSETRAARVHELMHMVDLDDSYLNRYPHELSGGQAQRVGLCRALVLDPSVLLLDEPFGALDAETRRDVQGEFLRLQKQKPRTTILVTHDLDEARRLAQRIIVLSRGKVVEEMVT